MKWSHVLQAVEASDDHTAYSSMAKKHGQDATNVLAAGESLAAGYGAAARAGRHRVRGKWRVAAILIALIGALLEAAGAEVDDEADMNDHAGDGDDAVPDDLALEDCPMTGYDVSAILWSVPVALREAAAAHELDSGAALPLERIWATMLAVRVMQASHS